jgi:hypothetical protein
MKKKTLKLGVTWHPDKRVVVLTVPPFLDDEEATEILLPAEYDYDPPYFDGVVLRGEDVTEEKPSILGRKKFTRPATDHELNELLAQLYEGGRYQPPKVVTAKLTELVQREDEARVMIDIGPANYVVVMNVKVNRGEYGGADEPSGEVVPVIPPVEMESVERLLEVLVQHLYPEVEITV